MHSSKIGTDSILRRSNLIKHIYPDKHIACYYTTHAEAETPEVMAYLQNEFATCKANKIRPAVFYSGSEDLPDLTSALLVSNRNRMAEREVRAEREAAAQLS